MKIKEQAINELESLKPSDVLVVYDLMLSLKAKKREMVKPSQAYIKVRKALSGCKGLMSKDIIAAREDRV